jgi:hypothetical protein
MNEELSATVAAAITKLTSVIQTLSVDQDFATKCPTVYAKWILARGFVVQRTAEAWRIDESMARRAALSDAAWVEISKASDPFFSKVFGTRCSMNTVKGVIEEWVCTSVSKDSQEEVSKDSLEEALTEADFGEVFTIFNLTRNKAPIRVLLVGLFQWLDCTLGYDGRMSAEVSTPTPAPAPAPAPASAPAPAPAPSTDHSNAAIMAMLQVLMGRVEKMESDRAAEKAAMAVTAGSGMPSVSPGVAGGGAIASNIPTGTAGGGALAASVPPGTLTAPTSGKGSECDRTLESSLPFDEYDNDYTGFAWKDHLEQSDINFQIPRTLKPMSLYDLFLLRREKSIIIRMGRGVLLQSTLNTNKNFAALPFRAMTRVLTGIDGGSVRNLSIDVQRELIVPRCLLDFGLLFRALRTLASADREDGENQLDAKIKVELGEQIHEFEAQFLAVANTICTGTTVSNLFSTRHITSTALLLQLFLQCWGHAQNPDRPSDPSQVAPIMMRVWDRHYLRDLGGKDLGGRENEYHCSGELLRDSMMFLGYKCDKAKCNADGWCSIACGFCGVYPYGFTPPVSGKVPYHVWKNSYATGDQSKEAYAKWEILLSVFMICCSRICTQLCMTQFSSPTLPKLTGHTTPLLTVLHYLTHLSAEALDISSCTLLEHRFIHGAHLVTYKYIQLIMFSKAYHK